MVESWEKRLKQASFRGVAFGYFDYSTESGRRTAEHTYPFRDDAYIEDMGLAPDKLSLSAFLLGSDHDVKADALEAALRQAGHGELIHPRHGTLTVQLQTYTRSESTQAGGMTRFTLNFIKTGAARYPTALRNVQSNVLTLLNSSRADVLTRTYNTALTIYQQLRDVTWVINQIGGLAALLLPHDFKVSIPDGLSIRTNVGLYQAISATLASVAIVPLTPTDTLSGGWLVQAANLDQASLQTAYPRLLNATDALMQALPVNQADTPANLYLLPVAVTLELATQTASVTALLNYDTADAALTARNQAHALLDACLPMVPLVAQGIVPVELYEQLRALRALIADTINQQALTLPKIRQAIVRYQQPALTLSQRLYQDATRTADIVQRNNIIHPLFVSGALEYTQ